MNLKPCGNPHLVYRLYQAAYCCCFVVVTYCQCFASVSSLVWFNCPQSFKYCAVSFKRLRVVLKCRILNIRSNSEALQMALQIYIIIIIISIIVIVIMKVDLHSQTFKFPNEQASLNCCAGSEPSTSPG